MVKLVAVGDISLNVKTNSHPFGKIKDAFSDKDILFGNLETVLSNKGRKAKKAVLLYAPPQKVEYLKDAGFDILNLANNHIMDLGPEGFNETLEVLNQRSLKFIGVKNKKFNHSYVIIGRKNIKVGFLGYYGYGYKNNKNKILKNKINNKNIIEDIKILKSLCNVIVISLHWGIEDVFYPSPEQIELARRFIDSGATLILGHGPHIVQGIETYKKGLIAYSLGNFQFNFDVQRAINKKVNESLILSVKLTKNGVESYDVLPVKINVYE
ncbi:MAG: CapA family protein [Candidatus Helarchaeota archaeon]